ncbi:MAG: hypothetical protein RLZZ58_63 [Pseudomonadota bacterium]
MAEQEKDALYGVGGWLLFLVVIIGIISPLRVLVETAANLNIDDATAASLGPNWGTYVGLTWVIAALSVVGAIWLAWRLYKVHTPQTLKIAKVGLWALAFAPSLADMATSALLFPDIMGAYFGGDFAIQFAKLFVFPTVWTLYLFKSRRVANTYGGAEKDAHDIFA